MFGKLMKHYGKGKIAEGISALTDAIVAFDPEGATEAEIEVMEENFDTVNKEFSKAKQEWAREQKEADEVVALYNRRLDAAGILQGQVDADPTNVQVQTGLAELVTALESMTDDVDREKEEAADAKEVMDELEQTVKMYAENLKNARSQLKSAARNMEKAKRTQERNEAAADRAARLAGLKKGGSALGSALESMNKQAAAAQADADAAKHKAALLGKTSVDDNDAVAAALAQAAGKPAAATSVADRLAALRK